MAAITTTELKELKVQVSEHEIFINGNGKKGAKERMATIELEQSNIKDDIKEIKDGVNKAVGWIVGAAITFIVGLLIWLFSIVLPSILAHLAKAV